MKPQVLLIGLLFMFISSFIYVTKSHSGEGKVIRSQLAKQLSLFQKRIDALKDDQLLNDRVKIASAFDSLRLSYKSLEWFLILSNQYDTFETINNSKHWVASDPIYLKGYPEAGSFQILEKMIVTDSIDWTSWNLQINKIEQHNQELKAGLRQLQIGQGDLFYSFALDVYLQFNLTLVAYDRIESSKSWNEYVITLKNYLAYLTQLDSNGRGSLENQKQKERVQELINYCSNSSYETIDRINLFRKHLKPLALSFAHFAENQSGSNPPFHLKQFNWGNFDLFDPDWLKKEAFTGIKHLTKQAELAKLGELLFFDPILSKNNKRSCASCHKPDRVFTDGRQTSLGFDFSSKLNRNSPSLINVIYNRQFGHDLAHDKLEAQFRQVFTNHQEFRTSTTEIRQKLQAVPEYVALFKACFPKETTIDSTQIFKSLITYLEKLTDLNSPFDQYMKTEEVTSKVEIHNGFNLFMGKAQCGGCHFPPFFSGLKPPLYNKNKYFTLIDPNQKQNHYFLFEDRGMGQRTAHDSIELDYDYFFKIPSLRNLTLSKPYLHDGSFFSINQTLKFLSEDSLTAHLGIPVLSQTELSELERFLTCLDSPNQRDDNEALLLPEGDGTLVPRIRRPSGLY